jgi:predicted ArsR family transcriptional regulator
MKANRPVENKMPALSHRDNIPSLIAARRVEHSGAGKTQRAAILAMVRRMPGMTSREIAKETGIESHRVSSRLVELREDVLVQNDEMRVCQVAGQHMKTWWPSGTFKQEITLRPARHFHSAPEQRGLEI